MIKREGKVPVELVVALMLVGWTNAQNTNTTPANQQTTAANQPTTTPNQPATTNTPNTSTTQRTTSQSANTNTPTTTAQSVVVTGVPTGSTASTTSPLSTISVGGGLDVPTIAGYGIPTPMVPWTAGAPFMMKSNLPEGTIFIAVGAILGAMGAAVLLWRALVAWSLHRSVKKANEKLSMGQVGSAKLVKGGFTQSSLALAGSNMSLDHLSAPQRKPTRTSLAPSVAAARNSSLFFSPTAGAGQQTSGTYSSINRSSGMLPSGYYAAPGAQAPNTSYIGGNGSRNSVYGARTSQYNISPPSSPGLPPSRDGLSNHGQGIYNQPSTSTLNLHVPGNRQPGGRAPSANLDDLFGNDPMSARR